MSSRRESGKRRSIHLSDTVNVLEKWEALGNKCSDEIQDQFEETLLKQELSKLRDLNKELDATDWMFEKTSSGQNSSLALINRNN